MSLFCLLIFASAVYAQNPSWLNSLASGGTVLVGWLVEVLTGVALVVFFWGLVKFISQSGDEKAVASGKQLMVWGVIGLFVIIAVWGLVEILQNFFVWGGPSGQLSPPQTS